MRRAMTAIVDVVVAIGDRVVSAIAPRMATDNPFERKPAATDNAVASERLDRVV